MNPWGIVSRGLVVALMAAPASGGEPQAFLGYPVAHDPATTLGPPVALGAPSPFRFASSLRPSRGSEAASIGAPVAVPPIVTNLHRPPDPAKKESWYRFRFRGNSALWETFTENFGNPLPGAVPAPKSPTVKEISPEDVNVSVEFRW